MAKTKKFKLIKKPGFYPDIPEDDYLADPVETPSLNSTVCKMIVNRSPRHARYCHPRLNPKILETPDDNKRPMDIGSAVHKRLLGLGKDVFVIEGFADYKKQMAKDARDRIRSEGHIPLLEPDMDIVEEIVAAAQEQLNDEGLGKLFTKGTPELTMVWQDKKGVWCRGRLDYFHDEAKKQPHIVVPELKTTLGSAHHDDWQQTFFNLAYDYQAVMYERGLRKLLPHLRSVEFMWIVLEQKPPYGLNIVRMGNQAQSEAMELVEIGIDIWEHCLRTGQWPGYDCENPGVDPAFWRSSLKEARRLALHHRLALWQRPLT